ncbi:MAG: carbonic anhydrase [Acidocella sp. 35-58-6]|nr:MAG: carbonic anhydrase [Acidocella sp. 35-58-6]
MNNLMAGHKRFRSGYWRRYQKRFATLARDGQAPEAMVIACSDSRVSPEVIFDCAPGEIFVVRNVSNLVPPYAPDTGNHGTSAALEFAVTVLKVKTLVVLGHSLCGGIRALMSGPAPGAGDFIESWMKIAQRARQRVCDSPEPGQDFEGLCHRCEQESIKVSLDNLMTFPWITERVKAGTLTLAGLHFDVQTGKLEAI